MILILSPLDQFIEVSIFNLFNYILVTKSSIYILLTIALIIFVNIIVSTNVAYAVYSINDIVLSTAKDLVQSYKYFPYLVSVTFIILFINLVGNIPYGFSPTSSLIICLGFSLSLWLSLTLLIFARYKMKALSFFLPAGTPIVLTPLLVLIELVSYISRAFSLGIRLFSNIVAGHTLTHLISSFLFSLNVLYGFIPFIIFVILCLLELAVSFIQTYVLLLLISAYIRDALALH